MSNAAYFGWDDIGLVSQAKIQTCRSCSGSIKGEPKYRVLKYDESLRAFEDFPLCSADCYRDFLSCELDDFRREDFK